VEKDIIMVDSFNCKFRLKDSEKAIEKKIKCSIEQYDENENLLRKWGSIKEIILENPSYKWQNIYSCCNGYKKRIYGFKWRKIPKINEDIVRSL